MAAELQRMLWGVALILLTLVFGILGYKFFRLSLYGRHLYNDSRLW